MWGSLGVCGGVALGLFVVYALDMPKGQSVIDRPQTRIIGAANVENRLNAAELRHEIHKSGVCQLGLEMARTGRRPVYDEDSDEFRMEDMSESVHVDLIKFFARKVLPDAKEIYTVEEKADHDRWTALAAEIEVVC